MAIACPVDLDTLKLRAEIQSIYARVAADPSLAENRARAQNAEVVRGPAKDAGVPLHGD